MLKKMCEEVVVKAISCLAWSVSMHMENENSVQVFAQIRQTLKKKERKNLNEPR